MQQLKEIDDSLFLTGVKIGIECRECYKVEHGCCPCHTIKTPCKEFFPRFSVNGRKLSEAMHKELEAIKEMPGLTRISLSRILNIPSSSIHEHLNKLEVMGLIESNEYNNKKKGRPVYLWYATF